MPEQPDVAFGIRSPRPYWRVPRPDQPPVSKCGLDRRSPGRYDCRNQAALTISVPEGSVPGMRRDL
jgi:hypothetical protein